MSILDLIYPQKCRACGAKLRSKDLALCAPCRSEYEKAKKSKCEKCGRKFFDCTCRASVGDKFVREYFTLFKYSKDTPGGALILSIKDRKDAQALKLLSRDMEGVLRKRLPLGAETLLTYVPRKPESLREKGVDQARELTKRISENSDLPYAQP